MGSQGREPLSTWIVGGLVMVLMTLAVYFSVNPLPEQGGEPFRVYPQSRHK